MAEKTDNKAGIVAVGGSAGHVVIDKNSPLRRLHYFDGKFLRAPDMQLEQRALLNEVRFANRAGGAGVVYGFNCTQGSGDTLNISAGLAFDPHGRALHMGVDVPVNIAELIEKSRASTRLLQKAIGGISHGAGFGDCISHLDPDRGSAVVEHDNLYLITLNHVESYCGEEDVYGKLCEEACVTSKQRPYIVEGVEIRAVPLSLSAALAHSNSITLTGQHYRSRVASAYFEQERRSLGSPMSRELLASSLWCHGASMAGGESVAIAVLARSGSTTLFLDAWTARRERMESPPRHYWAGRMAMRSWNIFLAQVLQFQCQLRGCLTKMIEKIDLDPCAKEKQAALQAAQSLKQMLSKFEAISQRLEKMEHFNESQWQELLPQGMADAKESFAKLIKISKKAVPERMLIDCGIVELPSAGYLPVEKDSNLSINEQVRRMMYKGVDLRFCVVRSDYIPHALEESQHMERISLLHGLDHPDDKPKVDILVPDGVIKEYHPETDGTAYEMELCGADMALMTQLNQFGKAAIANSLKADDKTASSTFWFNPKVYFANRFTKGAEVGAAQKDKCFRGAARGEALESGGFAFYFAGRVPQLAKVLFEVAIEPQIREYAREKSANRLFMEARSPEEVKIEPAAAASDADADAAGEPAETAREAYDLWLNMRSDRDPFQLSKGGSTNVSFELVFALNGGAMRRQPASVVAELTQNGVMIVEEVLSLSASGESRLRCRMSSNGLLNIKMNLGGADKTITRPMKLNEQLYLSREPDTVRPTVRVSVPSISVFNKWDTDNIDIDVGFEFKRHWTAVDEAEFEAVMTSRVETESGHSASKSVPLFSGRQRISQEVTKPGNLSHDTSLLALKEIGSSLEDQAFDDIRARLLFPPPKPVPKELLVYAARDWVLFRRRRDITCGYDKAPQAQISTRRYRLFYVNTLKTDEDLAVLRRGLMENRANAISQYKPIAAGIVEFDAGLYSVLTSHANLQLDWKTIAGNDKAEITLGAIGSVGAAYDEGANLAALRLQSVSGVLSPVTPLDEEAQLLTLPTAPDLLMNGDIDGVIVMASVSVAAVCHRVYRVDMQLEEINDFEKMLSADYKVALQRFGAKELQYKPSFKSGTANFAKANAATDIGNAWSGVGNTQPRYVFTVAQAGEDSTGNATFDQPYSEQSQAIAQVVGGVDLNNGLVGVQGGIEGCPGITILITTPQVQLGVVVAHGALMIGSIEEHSSYVKEGITSQGYWEWLSSAEDVQAISLGIVRYDENDAANPTNLSNLKVTAHSEQLWGGFDKRDYVLFLINPNGTAHSEMERNKAQAEQIRQAFALDRPLEVLVTPTLDWGHESTSAVFLLAAEKVAGTWPGVVFNAVDFAGGNSTNLVASFNNKEITFSDTGTVVKDNAFKASVKDMVENNTKVKQVEIVAVSEAEAKIEMVKSRALLKALQDKGVASSNAEVVMRIATGAEKEKLLSRAPGSQVAVMLSK